MFMSAVNLFICTFIATHPYQRAIIEVLQNYHIINSGCLLHRNEINHKDNDISIHVTN